jgi:sugar phosphate isomerase/epimerase
MKIAVRENMVPGADLEERLDFLERIGYDGIELTNLPTVSRSPCELARIFRDHWVRPTTIEGVRQLLDPDPAARQSSLDLLRERLALAATLDAVGVLVVPIFGGPRVPDLSPHQTALGLERGLFLAELQHIAGDAERAGSTVILEPLNRYETHFINTLDQGAEYCRRVNRPGIRIMADFFHMAIEEANIATSIRLSAPFIRYVHVADSNRLQPGRGHTDFRSGFRALKDAGYDGYLGVECGLVGTPEHALREAATYLRATWAEA